MLPVEEILPALKASLAQKPNAVLVAPPGAGKTTMVPLALKDEPWADGGKLILLEPRRLAARAAAARMAATLGEAVGETVGFRVRAQSRVSARTRIEVVTEGVFTRMILDDPGLEGVAAVLFDEFHERSLDADLGLAFALDSQRLLRGDLRLLAMSATLDGARVAALMDGAPVLESQGRMFPVETRYLGRDAALRPEDQVVRAVQRALAEEEGGVLAFLPGQAEIRRAETALVERVGGRPVDIAPLYGALEVAAQDRAVAPAMPGRRKVVLATAIAETSLTLEGVRVVIDAGLSRVPRFDPASGLTRLATVRVSRAAADQRRGRAGRTAPGVCYRLWDEAETRALPSFERPEILEADLSRLALDLARWGARDAGGLSFLDPPPSAAFAEARALLRRLNALDDAGAMTAHGEAMAGLPLAPRLAHMVLRGAAAGQSERAARIAAVLSDPGLGGRDADLRARLERLNRSGDSRARDALRLAARWAQAAGKPAGAAPLDDAMLLAEAYPERIAQARGGRGEFRLASGRGAYLDPTDALASAPWLAVAELGGGAARDRILLAAPLDEADLRAAFADRLESETVVEPDEAGRIRVRRRLRLDRLVLEDRIVPKPDPALVVEALTAEVRRQGLAVLPMADAAAWLARVALLRRLEGDPWPDLTEAVLLSRAPEWMPGALSGVQSLSQVRAGDVAAALANLLPYDLQRRLERDAPARFEAPTGSRLVIDYAAEGGPRVDVRVQELFGLTDHPAVAQGRAPLVLALLSPGHRPIQLTRDLPGFWRGSWAEVRKEMRGRYPKHPWPEDPANALPTTRAKPRV